MTNDVPIFYTKCFDIRGYAIKYYETIFNSNKISCIVSYLL